MKMLHRRMFSKILKYNDGIKSAEFIVKNKIVTCGHTSLALSLTINSDISDFCSFFNLYFMNSKEFDFIAINGHLSMIKLIYLKTICHELPFNYVVKIRYMFLHELAVINKHQHIVQWIENNTTYFIEKDVFTQHTIEWNCDAFEFEDDESKKIDMFNPNDDY